MKKRLMLLALPALMVLAGCNPLSDYAAAGTKVDLFAEDTLAHEELFGEADNLQPRMLGNPEEDPGAGSGFTLTPKVGVQFFPYTKDEANLLAVRYVAAIASTDLAADGITATWTRGVSEKNSNQIKTLGGGHESTVLYTSLNNGGTPKSATSEGTGYNRYVVYTLYDIPASQSSSYIAAYLTLSKAGQSPVESRVVVAQIDGGHYFSFNKDSDLVKDGYFLQSSTRGIVKQNNGADTDPTNNEKNNAEFTEESFSAGEKFGLFRFDDSNNVFQFYGYNTFLKDTSARFIKSTSIDEYNELYLAGEYTLYVNENNLVYTEPTNVTTTLYVRPGTNWNQEGDSHAPRFAAHFFGGSDGDYWVSMTNSSQSGVYQVSVNIATSPKVQFCRMNGNTVENNWSNCYNNTKDLIINGDNGPSNMSLRKYIVWDNAWSNGDGHWEAGPAE